MASNIEELIEFAKHLKDDITKVGKRSSTADGSEDMNVDVDAQTGPVPVSAPDSMSADAVQLTVTNNAAYEDLASRLQETKEKLLDLCQRQYDDLQDMEPSGSQTDVEDVESLVGEMKSVKRCMDTIASLERALRHQ